MNEYGESSSYFFLRYKNYFIDYYYLKISNADGHTKAYERIEYKNSKDYQINFMNIFNLTFDKNKLFF